MIIQDIPELDEAWFKEYGATEPSQAAAEWRTWLQGRHDEQVRYKKALSIAAGISMGAVGHYLHGRAYKLSERTIAKLDALSKALGVEPTPRRERREELARLARSERRVALLVDLARVPSRPFHMAVIDSVLDGATAHNFSLSLHQAQQSSLPEDIERILRHYRPDGIIFLRLTPDKRAAAILKKWEIPTALIHAHRLDYPCLPFIANVVPNQERLGAWVRAWTLHELPGEIPPTRRSVGEIVMVAMPDEDARVEFPPIRTGVEPAIRNERKQAIINALKDQPLVVETVEDYSFRHAYAIGMRHRDVIAWIALSDEIGVALKQILLTADPSSAPRIIGFDDSELARIERITSIGQHVEEVGILAVDAVSDWFTSQAREQLAWKECKELITDLQLTLRD